MLARLIKVVLVLGLLIAAAAAGTYVRVMQWAEAKVALPADAVVEFKAGTGLSSLAHQLAQSGAHQQ